jgi:hypothetical protein
MGNRQEEMYTGEQLTGRDIYRWARQEEMYTGNQLTGRDVYRWARQEEMFTVSNRRGKCIQVNQMSHHPSVRALNA